ncbi:DUF4828 domain-containing protein [Carnobacterium sp.]|uniref:DUF4828 domain-containing protein n=1 Tax=Carnobacterium sp. TaxID=48221 RepID=UPI003C7419C1
MQRKHFIKMLISFTVMSRLFYIIKNTRKHQLKTDPITFFIGNWHVSEPNTPIEMSIQIDANRQVFLNKQMMNGHLISVEKDKLIFKDHFGYEIIVTKLSETSLNLFDEADEKNYQLIRETELS